MAWRFEWIRNTPGMCNICGEGYGEDHIVGVFQTGEEAFQDVWLCPDCLANAIRKISPTYKMTPKKDAPIQFDLSTLKWKGITIEQVKRWEAAFPNVDVVNTILHKMPMWLDANPSKAKKTLWKKFIVGWLSREQTRYDQFGSGR
jgi:hypothetical protein